jgi:TPR repeat protein
MPIGDASLKASILLIIWVFVFLTPPVISGNHSMVTECDKLVSHVEDPDRVATGVKEVMLVAGTAACRDAVKNDPENPRLRYQLARVLFYSEITEESISHLEFSAKAGSEQAQFVLGYIADTGLQGVTRSPCIVEDLWFRSATQGRFAALVSYPRHVALGKFKDCTIQAGPSEILKFLAKAKEKASGYYQKLLVNDVAVQYNKSL